MLELNNLSLLAIAAIALNGLLFVKILIQPSQDRTLKLLLVLLTLCLSASVISHLYRYRATGLYLSFPHFSGYALILTFCLGPVLYWYVRQVTVNARPWSQRFWYLHLIIPLLVTLYIWPHFTRTTTEKLIAFRSQQGQHFRGYLYLLNYGLVLFYLALSWNPLSQYQRGIVNYYSNIQKITLGWLRIVCLGLALVMTLGILTILLDARRGAFYAVFLSASALLTIVVVFSALEHRQLSLIRAEKPSQKTDKETELDQQESSTIEPKDRNKYIRSGLDLEVIQLNLKKLHDLMQSRQLYLHDSLSLGHLASELDLSTHHLSQLLNEQLNTNFYDYINALRIEHAKQLLATSPEQAIIDIAYASGYNAKSTFYNAFKKHLGTTPVAYRRQLQSNKNLLPQIK